MNKFFSYTEEETRKKSLNSEIKVELSPADIKVPTLYAGRWTPKMDNRHTKARGLNLK